MDAQIDAVRHFNRFYTKQIGVLSEGLLESPFSLTEARVIYEVAQRGSATAAELAVDVDLGGDDVGADAAARSAAK